MFCDFDGTITAEDTFDAVAAAVVPQVWWPLKERLFNFELNLRDAMASLASALSPADLAAMVEHMGEFEPRPGFLPFLDALDAAGLPFVLVSGGWCPWWKRCWAPTAIAWSSWWRPRCSPTPTPTRALSFTPLPQQRGAGGQG